MLQAIRVVLILGFVAAAVIAAVPELRQAMVDAYRAVRPHVFERNDEWCLVRLQERDLQYTRVPDTRGLVGRNAQCGVRYGVAAEQLDGVRVPAPNVMTCRLAEQLQEWVVDGVQPAARELLGSPVARIEHVGIFACRNVAGSSRLSGHAQANAIDVAGFRLEDGRRVSVLKDWGDDGPKGRFLRLAGEAACDRFGTALTPEYNAAHRDHLHLEAGMFGICGM